jgi:hypothetical protein
MIKICQLTQCVSSLLNYCHLRSLKLILKNTITLKNFPYRHGAVWVLVYGGTGSTDVVHMRRCWPCPTRARCEATRHLFVTSVMSPWRFYISCHVVTQNVKHSILPARCETSYEMIAATYTNVMVLLRGIEIGEFILLTLFYSLVSSVPSSLL